MLRNPPACAVVAIICIAVCLPGAASSDDQLSRIAFGSCAKQDRPQPIWDAVVNSEPDLFLFIGDNIYGDTEDMDVLREKWGLLGAQPGYRALNQACPILATWDDHDFGDNDAGVEYPRKVESQQIFLDFFNEPVDSPRRSRPGVYGAWTFGPPDRRVQIILLDTRYFRSPLVERNWRPEPGEGDKGPYGRNLDPQATLLGEAQWAWLADQLREPARLRIIGSSIQVVADGHHWEKWGNLPLERTRLLELIRDTAARGVIFISGDRHSAEISVLDDAVGYPLIDVTSSSLNQPSEWHSEPNRYRDGTKYIAENFGMITIDWNDSDPVVRCQVRGISGDVVLQHRARLSRLQQ